LALAANVLIHIETTPPSARVFLDGKDQGPTPLDLNVTRGQAGVPLDIRKAGFATVVQTVVPDMDQRLVLTLTAAAAPNRRQSGAKATSPGATTASGAAAPPSPPPSPPPASTEGGFRRFE
jgi:hypothetical protein